MDIFRPLFVISGQERTGKHTLATALAAQGGWTYVNFERCLGLLIEYGSLRRIAPVPFQTDIPLDTERYCTVIEDYLPDSEILRASHTPLTDNSPIRAAQLRRLLTNTTICEAMYNRIEQLVEDLPLSQKLLLVTRSNFALDLLPPNATDVLYLSASLEERARRMMSRSPEDAPSPPSPDESTCHELKQRDWQDAKATLQNGCISDLFGYRSDMIPLDVTDLSLDKLLERTQRLIKRASRVPQLPTHHNTPSKNNVVAFPLRPQKVPQP